MLVSQGRICLTSQQHASVSQGRICSDSCTCCHTEIEIADPTFYLTQSQYTDTGATSPSADLVTPDAWQGSHWSTSFQVTGVTRPLKNAGAGGDWSGVSVVWLDEVANLICSFLSQCGSTFHGVSRPVSEVHMLLTRWAAKVEEKKKEEKEEEKEKKK